MKGWEGGRDERRWRIEKEGEMRGGRNEGGEGAMQFEGG